MSAVDRGLVTRKRSQNLSSLQPKQKGNSFAFSNKSWQRRIENLKKKKKKKKRRDLGGENGDGVLGAEGNQIRGGEGDVVDYSVASCSDERSLYFHTVVVSSAAAANRHYFAAEK